MQESGLNRICPDIGILEDTGACAVFFYQVANISFPGDVEIAQGTCQAAMGDNCVNAIVKRAMSVDVSGLGISDACNKLQSTFEDNLDTACANFTGSVWSGLRWNVSNRIKFLNRRY
jgi:hypothetical protein